MAKFFIYIALISPLIITRGLFFPFITGKVLLFRTATELALLFFLLELFFLSKKYNWKNVLSQPLFLSVSVFIALFVITSFTAFNPTIAFWYNFERAERAWQMIHKIVLFALTTIIFKSKSDWKKLLAWQVAVSSAIALYGLAQTLKIGGQFIVSPGPISGTLGNSSYLSIFMVFGLFFIIWLLFEEKNRYIKMFLYLSGLLHIFMLFQTETRATFLAIAIGIISAALLAMWRLHKRHKHKFSQKILALCYAGVFITVLLIALVTVTFISNIRGGDAYNALLPRFWTWGSALSGFLEKPILGWGAENFPYVFDKYYNANHYGIESWFDRTHNIFLEYLISGGLALLSAYLSIFYFLFKGLIRLQKDDDWFWPIFISMPIIYLINGLTLFEVLPIYLNLFLFLAFFINYKLEFQT